MKIGPKSSLRPFLHRALQLLMRRPYISILMHKHSVFMKLETKLRD